MADSLHIALLQSPIVWENVPANLNNFEQKIREVAAKEVQLCILPELFTTGFSVKQIHLAETMQGLSINWLVKLCRELNVALAGTLMIEENGQIFNRFVLVDKNGEIQYYDKRHLFGLGDEATLLSAGQERKLFHLDNWRILPLVCYDLRFPVWARNQANEAYDVLICAAAWPASRIMVWDTLLTARAIENQAYAVGVNCIGKDGNELAYCGHSNVIDALGNRHYDAISTESIIYATLSKKHLKEIRHQFPFLNDADSFELL